MRELEIEMGRHTGDELTRILAKYGDVSDEFQQKEGYDLEHRIDAVTSGMNISYLPRSQEVDILSGGEKARIGLATLLIKSPDLLLLDEPTNHLDILALEWLESYLSNFRGAIVVVSHERHFLNRTVEQIVEVNEYTHQVRKYSGDYEEYRLAKERERGQWEEEYQRQQDEVAELRNRIRAGAAQGGHDRPAKDSDKLGHNYRGGRAQGSISRTINSAQKQLRRIELDPIPRPPKPLRIDPRIASERIQSNMVCDVSHLTKNFPNRRLLDDISFVIAPESRIVLTGPNGTGKTTLLRIIMGLEPPDAGSLKFSGNLTVGYLPQDSIISDAASTLLEAYRSGLAGHREDHITELIQSDLFKFEDLAKPLKQLSIGQRRKLEIARLAAQHPNVLLLDEPTNYISLEVLEAFEDALIEFPGPIVAVSHDRRFIERLGGEIWELSQGRIVKQCAQRIQPSLSGKR